jgi:hypothetical protein
LGLDPDHKFRSGWPAIDRLRGRDVARPPPGPGRHLGTDPDGCLRGGARRRRRFRP